MIGIYKITNIINNKIYIGKSKNIQERWNEHKRESSLPEEKWQANKRGEQTYFHKAMRKYGVNNFTFEIIETCLEEELNEKEIYWISYYNSTNHDIGYNTTLGGDGYKCGGGEKSPGHKITQEECNIIKQKLREHWTAQQIIEIIPTATSGIISAINYGKTWYDKNETYPISIDNGHRIWSDDEALLIKNKYADGETIVNLAKEYQVSIGTISDLVKGKTYTNLPVISRRVDWQRTNTAARRLSDEEVKLYRAKVQEGQSMLSVYDTYKPAMGYAAFRNMIKRITYKNVQ